MALPVEVGLRLVKQINLEEMAAPIQVEVEAAVLITTSTIKVVMEEVVL